MEKAEFEVTAMCEVLGVSPSAYYEWVAEQEAEHARRDAELAARVRALFVQFKGRYGAPRIHAELAKEGERVSRKRVARLMRESGLRAKSARKYKATTDSNHSLPVAPNLLGQRFKVDAPNKAWVSDITYLWTRQGWLYLCVIIDLYSRKVVGWSLRERMTAELVCEALDAAVKARRPPPGLVFHSDRGSQYASRVLRRRLWRYRMRQSMSAKGNCWDNAVAESFFATLKKELVRNRAFPSREAARSDVFEYIEVLQPAARTLVARLRDADGFRSLRSEIGERIVLSNLSGGSDQLHFDCQSDRASVSCDDGFERRAVGRRDLLPQSLGLTTTNRQSTADFV